MYSIVPQAPSESSSYQLQDRFNRDVNTAIKQIREETEARLSKLETDLALLTAEWREFYDVEWEEYQEATENRFLAIENAMAAP